MRFELIDSEASFDDLSEEWNALLACSASHVPFLRHEYLRAWWRTLGGGEWSAGELRVITARQEDGKLVGAAPLFLTEGRDGKATLMLLGSYEISDYLDVLACPQHLPDFVEGLLTLLETLPDWRTLDLYNLLETSPTLPQLERVAEQRGWRVFRQGLQHCPYIPLPGDWERYLAEQVDKKQRHEIRRKVRRLEESGLSVRWYIVTERQSLAGEIDAFLRLMAYDPEKARFLTEVMRLQMCSAVQAAFDAGWLQLAFLEIGGEKAAAYLNFDYDNTVWVYNSGLDFKFRDWSPGWVLLAYLLQWANAHKRAVFDFMRGDEAYKYRFGAVDRRVVRLTVER